jgi:tetratricopeptide (TPR) repeat protein
LDEARQACGDAAELRLARAGLVVRAARETAAAALPPLAEGLDRFAPAERRKLLDGLAAACLQAGLPAEAERLWRRLAGERPNDLRARIALFDLAIQANDLAKVEAVLQEIRQIEGDDGVIWRYGRVASLLVRAQGGDRSGLDEARRLLASVAARRSEWSRVPLCEARLHELENHPDAALQSYLRAIQLGETDPDALRRAVELLYAHRRFAEASDLLRRVPEQAALPALTQRVGAELALYSQDRTRALSLAQAAVAADSRDPRDHLWLAGVYWRAGQPEKAEPEFLRARDLGPAAPETWLGLVEFLAATGKKDRAKAEVAAAEARLAGGPAALPLAACHEAIGDRDRAAQLYQAAQDAAPNDAATLRAVARFYSRANRVKDAQELLARLARHPDRDAAGWARRARALLLSQDGSPESLKEALAQLADPVGGSPAGDGSEAVANRRTRAQVLALQNSRRQRRAAAQMLDALIEEKVSTPADHLLAAQLYESLAEPFHDPDRRPPGAAGDWAKARGRYLGLLALPGGETASSLATVARSLLRHGDADGAGPVLAKLANAAPQALATRELQARLLHQNGQAAEAVKLLRACAPAPGPELQVVAGVLEELGEHAAAEQAYRTLAAQPTPPEAPLVLAQYLIRRKRYAEALDLCDRCWPTCRQELVAQVCVIALSEMPPDPSQFARVAGRLEAVIAAAPDQVQLPVALAAVRNFEGRFDQAEALYRGVLRRDPRQTTALNNLAWLLAVKGGHGEEALQLVERAAELRANDPDLLDTRGVAYLALGRPDADALALKELEAAVAEAPSPATYFHLARAQLALGRRKDAAQSWERAKGTGLTPEGLHALERPAFRELERQFH